MRPPIKYALRGQGVSNTFTKELYRTFIFAVTSKIVKQNYERFSRSFWLVNYNLEENRREHASLGHLWWQIAYCFALLAFRLAGKVVR